jgi:hypothetical protein
MFYPSAVIRKPDSALSSTSEYSVQNKVVKAALDLKADAADLANYYLKTETYNKTEVDNKVDSALTSAYKAGGSCAFANLPALSAANEGYVYDVSDAFTTTSDFVEGAGKSYPAGTNVAIIDVGSEGSPVYKYDVMAGFIDQTLLQTKALSSSDDQKPFKACCRPSLQALPKKDFQRLSSHTETEEGQPAKKRNPENATNPESWTEYFRGFIISQRHNSNSHPTSTKKGRPRKGTSSTIMNSTKQSTC